ncbi:hypothetical protein Q4E93_09980 [Flavitalea sp. BT771]|uniref:plasmid mobilization protein n=1 Tax=Flavitalea sp. BT771 TaxID=3063329 RepID=UPI0026E269B6|nr:hypothetical protein [Flavitalea sp. BT771]MDO6430916.1 hypothetical protein [Flavitalea sp. BT771]MDV6218944.1 hypothetical protein [Flavitalea sp. BT771]
MARPVKELGLKRTLRVDIRLTPDEQMRLFAKATEQGLSVSDLVRSAVLNSKPIMKRAVPDRAALIKGLGDLGKIGGLINQIAHELHRERITGKGPTLPDHVISNTLSRLQAVSDGLLKLLTDGNEG